MLVTHVHRDHFNALAVERHLIENPCARIVAPRQVADSLRILGSEYERIAARVHSVDAQPGQVAEIEVAGIPVRTLGIAHPPSRNQPVEHVARIEAALAPGCVIGFHAARGGGETARAWLSERAPEARLLTEPSTVSLAGCAGSS